MRLSNDITARATRFPHIPCDKAKLAQTWNLAKSESRFKIVKSITPKPTMWLDTYKNGNFAQDFAHRFECYEVSVREILDRIRQKGRE